MKDDIMHKVRIGAIVFLILLVFWPFDFPYPGFLVPTIRWYGFTSEERRAKTDMSIDEMVAAEFSEEEIRAVNKDKTLRSRAVRLGLDLQGGVRVVLRANFEEYAHKLEKSDASKLTATEKDTAMQALVKLLTPRVNAFGVSESAIRRIGEDRVLIEIPGAKDSTRIQQMLVESGELTFRFVYTNTPIEDADMRSGVFTNFAKVPSHCDVLYDYSAKDVYGRRVRGKPLFVEKDIIVSGDHLKDARATADGRSNAISFTLNLEGAKIFREATANNRGRLLAIIIDDRVYSAPVINDEIPSGRGQISGGFTMNEAEDLASILSEGALPVSVFIDELAVVGESIGRDAVEAGVISLILALVLVALYMLITYRISGLIADVALVANVLLVVAILSPLGFTLSLPGIAGIILTIGMAVDANVIILERIKEELSAERGFAESINAGFDRAFWTILDSNLTTLISAFVLWIFGSGAVQGFAVTLFFGVLMNLITALVVTRVFYDEIIIHNLIKKPSKLFI